MGKLFLTALFIAIATMLITVNTTTSEEFELWKQKYQISYSKSEQAFRELIFNQNLKKIKAHNADPKNTYFMEANKFAALTDDEFKGLYISKVVGYNSSKVQINHETDEEKRLLQEQPDVDWTLKGGVTSVKDQGKCGSCWAHTTAAVLESFLLIRRNITVDLSEQQLVDCVSGSDGCTSGNLAASYLYVKANGIATEAQYPYKVKEQSCRRNGGRYKFNVIRQANGCSGLRRAIQLFPIGVYIDSTNWSLYGGGIFNNCNAKVVIDHAVMLVGVIRGNWKIKNSWGPGWGEKGYMRLQGPKSNCGICQEGGGFMS